MQTLSYIKEYYVMGLYTESDLDIFVKAKWITIEEKEDIIKTK
ncbi:XkdX family protein [Clostridium botulinum]|nr:XkdX family protein [Clostridium botulinum]